MTIRFSVNEYFVNEDDPSGSLPVQVVRGSELGQIKLANPIAFRVIPISYAAIEQNMTEFSLPDGFVQLDEDDPKAPIFAIG